MRSVGLDPHPSSLPAINVTRSHRTRPSLDRCGVCFAGANPDDVGQLADKNLSIANLARAGGADDRVDNALQVAFVDDDFELHLREEVDRVFSTAIRFGVTLLAAEATHF